MLGRGNERMEMCVDNLSRVCEWFASCFSGPAGVMTCSPVLSNRKTKWKFWLFTLNNRCIYFHRMNEEAAGFPMCILPFFQPCHNVHLMMYGKKERRNIAFIWGIIEARVWFGNPLLKWRVLYFRRKYTFIYQCMGCDKSNSPPLLHMCLLFLKSMM